MPLMNEETHLPATTIVRRNAVFDLFEVATGFGPQGLVVYAPSFERNGYLVTLKERQPEAMNISYYASAGGREPTLRDLQELKTFAEEAKIDWVAALGGGSVMDLAKSASGLIGAPETVSEYHNAKASYASGVPFIAVPTTAGTGAEATGAGVFINEKTGVKKAIANPGHMARMVILDSEMLSKCPAQVIAHSGMDALTQAIEAYTSNSTTSFTDAIAETAIRNILEALPSVHEGYNVEKAETLLVGSYLAGIALCNAKLGVAHGLAHPLGARTHAPHGLLCAVLLPHVIEFNRDAMGDKYDRMSELAGEDIITHVTALNQRFGITLEISPDDLQDTDAILAETHGGSTKFNPKPVSDEDVLALLGKLIHVTNATD